MALEPFDTFSRGSTRGSQIYAGRTPPSDTPASIDFFDATPARALHFRRFLTPLS